jgi:hypothetical protein
MPVSAEFLSSNTQIAYPLDSNQTIPDGISGLFADAKFTVPSVLESYSFYLDSVHVTKTQLGLDLSITLNYSDGYSTKFISIPTQSIDTGSYYKVLYFSDPEVTGLHLMFVIAIEGCLFVTDSDPSNNGCFIKDNLNLKFSDSAIEKSPKHVQTISIYNFLDPSDRTRCTEIISNITGDVTFKPGYNFDFESTGSNFTANFNILNSNILLTVPNNNQNVYQSESSISDSLQGVILSALPGSGKGKIPGTEDTTLVSEQLRSKTGNILIKNNTCYDLIPNDKYGELRILNKCVACCQCSSYVDAVNRLHEVEHNLSTLNNLLLNITAGSYSEEADKFNDFIKSINDNPEYKYNVRVTGHKTVSSTKLTGIDDVKGTLVRVGFSGTISNPTSEPIVVSYIQVSCSGCSLTASSISSSRGGNTSYTSKSNEHTRTNIIPASEVINPGKSLSFTASFKDNTLVSDGDELRGKSYSGTVVISIEEASGKTFSIVKKPTII